MIVYDILFKAASEALLTLAKDPKYLNSATGIVAILHSWGQNLMYHPHLHTMVPAGGWNDQEQRWHPSRNKFFIPVRVVSALFRGTFLFYLKQAYADQRLTFAGSISQLKNSSHIINYLGRYAHRVAIANSRIMGVEGDMVTFSMKDYRDGRKKTIQLQATEFVRRFLLHVLPKSFCKVRYYGLFATRNRNTVLFRCRIALGKPKIISRYTGLTWKQLLQMITGKDIDICPVCFRCSIFYLKISLKANSHQSHENNFSIRYHTDYQAA